MVEQKILVGIITFAGEKYCRKEFVQMLGLLTHSTDVVFATNSGEKDAENIREVSKQLNNVEVLVTHPDTQEIVDICGINREAIRTYFLAGDWTHLVFIDSDMFVPQNMIEVLLSHNKDLVSGVYLNGVKDKEGRKRILPMVWATNREGNRAQASIIDLLIPRLIKAYAAGLGCCLIARGILKKVSFKQYSETGNGEDFQFFMDARNAGYDLWVDTRVQCPHIKFPLGDERNRLYDLRNYKLDVKKK